MTDWTMYILIFQILLFVINITGFALIKFNDLRHLGKDVSELKADKEKFHDKIEKKVEAIATSVKAVSDTVIAMSARCEERHKK